MEVFPASLMAMASSRMLERSLPVWTFPVKGSAGNRNPAAVSLRRGVDSSEGDACGVSLEGGGGVMVDWVLLLLLCFFG